MLRFILSAKLLTTNNKLKQLNQPFLELISFLTTIH